MDDKLLCVHRFSDGGLCNYPRDHRRHTRWPEWEPTFVRHPFVEPRRSDGSDVPRAGAWTVGA
jgi:hypothetical protein